jgi:hypothetical protein
MNWYPKAIEEAKTAILNFGFDYDKTAKFLARKFRKSVSVDEVMTIIPPQPGFTTKNNTDLVTVGI